MYCEIFVTHSTRYTVYGVNILGISCFYHDSAAALVRDGEIIAAAQEERFTRRKHDQDFPSRAAAYCLKEAGIGIGGIDYVVFYDKPLIKFERIVETALAGVPAGIRRFMQAMPLWLKRKLWIPDVISTELGYKGKILFTEHHEAHAASAFYPSPFQEAAFLTMDGVGEWQTSCFGAASGNSLEISHYLRFPHSVGLFYSAFTYYLGFKVNSGEYKVMGLAPYGRPIYADVILKHLVDLKDDGSFRLNMDYFGYCNGMRMINGRFERLFGAPARKPETAITQKDMDIAASIQQVTEDSMLRMSHHVHRVTAQENLCLAGGVALNCVANGRILREGPFKRIWIQPASGDAGGALGAALLVWYKYLGNRRVADGKTDAQKASFLGPAYGDAAIGGFLAQENIPFRKVSYAELPGIAAGLIDGGNVIGWFQGRMEFGPRALGARSIIADARNAEMQSKLNLKIKHRESFRPCAPVVLAERAAEWFDLDVESPYMLLTAPVKHERRLEAGADCGVSGGFENLKIIRSTIPAVTHVDYSARVQTVKRQDNPLFYDVINAFYEKTGCPVIINTSFNVRGEPPVCSPEDAYYCFMRTEMDYLVMGAFILDKKGQPAIKKDSAWQEEFELD